MKILNLYAGIGGNRKLWEGHEVTAVEFDPAIASVYKEYFPDDTVIVADAHQYLLDHYDEYDFIWSSPPCPSHGRYRFNIGFRAKGYSALYPDMKLYEEILLLKHYFKGLYVVENTKPYYKPLVEPTVILARHLLWSNFAIINATFESRGIGTRNKISDFKDFDIFGTAIKNKRQVMRNCVDPKLGLHVLSQALTTTVLDKQ